MLLGNTTIRLHGDALDGLLGGRLDVRVGAYLAEDVGDGRPLVLVCHVHVEQLLVEPRLLGQAGLVEYICRQLGGERFFFLRGQLLLGEGFGGFAFGLAHAGETCLLGLTLCLFLRHLCFQLLNLTLGLLDDCLLHGCRGLQQPQVVGSVDQVALTLGQVRIGVALTLEGLHERLGDVLDVRFNDGQ